MYLIMPQVSAEKFQVECVQLNFLKRVQHIMGLRIRFATQTLATKKAMLKIRWAQSGQTCLFQCREFGFLARQYGSAPTESTDPSSQLSTLVRKTNGWRNSKVRDAFSADFKLYLDELPKEDLREALRLLHRESQKNGWGETLTAAEQAFYATKRIDEASVAMGVARSKSGIIDYGYETDLGKYDELVAMGGGE